MARPTVRSSGEFSTIGATSATLTASDYSGAITADAIAVFIDLQEDDQTVTAPAGWVEVGQTVMAASAFGTSVSCFVLPPGVAKSGDYTFTYPSNTYQGATFAVVQGTNLRWQAGNAIDGDDNGTSIHIAGLPAGGVDRLGVAGVSSYNVQFAVNEGSWTLTEQSNGDFSALFVDTSVGTAAVADFDTGLNDAASSHASVAVVFYELADIDNLPGLELWLDANDAATITDTAGTVTGWDDKSPNAHTVTVSGNPQTGATTQNGRNVIDLDGTGDWLTVGSVGDFNFLHNGTEHTVVWVFRPGASANPNAAYGVLGTHNAGSAEIGAAVWWDDRAGSSREELLYHWVKRSGSSSTDSSVSWQTPADSSPADTFQIVQLDGDPTDGTPANRSTFTINGGAPIANNAVSGLTTASNHSHALRIGSLGSGLFPFLGSFAEVVVLSERLDSTDAAWLHDHLEARWISAGGPVTGTVAAPLGALTATVSGERERIATVSAPLGGVAATGTGARGRTGIATVALGELTVTAVGESGTDVTGTASVPLGGLAVVVSGERERVATVAAPLGALTTAATGMRGRTSSVTVALGGLTVAVVGDGLSGVTGTVAVPLGGLTTTGTGVRGRTGSVAVPLGGLTVAVLGDGNTGGTAAVPLGGLTVAVTGVRGRAGTVAVALGGILVAVVGEGETAAIANAPLGALTVTANGTRNRTGTATVPLGALTLAVIGVDVALALVIVGPKGTARHTPPRSTGRTPDSIRATALPSRA